MVDRKFGAKLAAIALAACALVSSATAQTESPRSSAEPQAGPARAGAASGGARYYIDFRAARIGTYGHSYVAYGRLNRQGKPADAHYADLHPMGNYLVMAVGHVLPVPANTQWDPDVLKLPVASSYVRVLDAAEYARLQAALRKARADKAPYWNALTNNCNHFVAQLARAIGLRAPMDLQVAYAFVPSLREMNEALPSPRSAARRSGPTRDGGPAVTAAQPPRS